ncbi:hypothetical protein KIW84_021794 [Lathyrus oleraceus]|uniref:Uncharacterized protein n=1 Tax=Pisum sativum TaxID=3888 RepID=A0A9D5BAC6_PEA|nr:hypothetical protein KIW84_021794 [Pisum sativum]
MVKGSDEEQDGTSIHLSPLQIPELLYVSVKMENPIAGNLFPHVFCSSALPGACDSSKALSMERESASTWEFSFVVPQNHGLDIYMLNKLIAYIISGLVAVKYIMLPISCLKNEPSISIPFSSLEILNPGTIRFSTELLCSIPKRLNTSTMYFA